MADENEIKTTQTKGLQDFDFLMKSISTKDGEGDERPTVVVTASSTEIDLATDRFSMSALKQMEAQFPAMTIFLNHQYKIPEDVFGKVSSAVLVQRDGHTDLDLSIEVETSNQRAVDTYNMVKNGTTLGVSVGVLVLDADFVKDDSTKGVEVLEITSIYTLEASVVGIPANRRSWVQNAIKAASALASKGGPVTHLADGTALIARADGTIVKMKAAAAEVETIDPDATEVDPPAAEKSAEELAAEAAAAEEAEKEAAAKPKPTDDGDGESADDKKPAKSLEFLPDTEKGLTGDAAARALCDKLYSLVWSMWDELYKGFSADSAIGEKRNALNATLDEFSTVAKRLVESVIDDYYGETPEEDAGETAEMASSRETLTSMFKDAFKSVFEAKAAPIAKAEPADEDATVRLIAQANAIIAKNRDLVGNVATLEAELKAKGETITGLFEAMDMVTEFPMFRKIREDDAGAVVYAQLSEQFPYLDATILAGLAQHTAKKNAEQTK